MKKQRTIEVDVCDFCSNESAPVVTCNKCGRHACAECGSVFEIDIGRPGLSPNYVLTSIYGKSADRIITLCPECSSALNAALSAFGGIAFKKEAA